MKNTLHPIRESNAIVRYTGRLLLLSLLSPAFYFSCTSIIHCEDSQGETEKIQIKNAEIARQEVHALEGRERSGAITDREEFLIVSRELMGALGDYRKLKVGSTLDDLLADFSQNGGVLHDTYATFHSKRDSMIQVDVEFTGGGLEGPDFKPHGKPVISKISRLYLESSRSE